VVSLDARNLNERADTVLVIPLSTSIVKPISTHLLLLAGETGLQHDSVACAENITTVRKTVLVAPDSGLRTISHRRIAELAEKVQLAMGVV
jgi:mRNA-degrading endonuclease toxin of MazEF toxin-antitoxin module